MRFAVLFALIAGVSCYAQTATLNSEGAPAENAQLRAEAVRVMEHANRVSTPSTWPPNQQTVHFRIGQPQPGQPFEGDYVSDIGVPGQRRQEWRYGTYNQVQVRNGNAFTVTRAEGVSPGFLPVIGQLTPIWLGHFDHEDIIRSITDQGDVSRCIQFVTLFGDLRQQNEICVDAKSGSLLSVRIGDKTIRNSNYFAFNRALLPGHIEQWAGDTLVMSMDQSIELKEYPPDFFGAPNNSKGCAASTAPSPIDVPQPEARTVSTNVVDVILNGFIDKEGHPYQVKPLDSLHPDLNQEALDLVAKWTYAAGTCNGEPNIWGHTFVVHFKGR